MLDDRAAPLLADGTNLAGQTHGSAGRREIRGVALGNPDEVNDPRDGRVQRRDADGVRLDLGDLGSLQTAEALDPVRLPAALELVQAGQLVRARGDDQLAVAARDDPPLVAVRVKLARPLHAQARLQGAGLVVDACVDDPARVTGLVPRDPGLALEDRDRGTVVAPRELAGDGEADDAGADDHEVARLRGICRMCLQNAMSGCRQRGESSVQMSRHLDMSARRQRDDSYCVEVRRQIVAFGGGGFSMEAGNPLLDDYVLSLTGVARPRVCFLATASGDADDYIVRFYREFAGARAEASHIRCSGAGAACTTCVEHLLSPGPDLRRRRQPRQPARGLARAPDRPILREAWEQRDRALRAQRRRALLVRRGLTAYYGPPELVRGLGFLPWSFTAHYDSEPQRRDEFHRRLGDGMRPGYAADDGAALHFVGTRLHQAVELAAAGPRARAADDRRLDSRAGDRAALPRRPGNLVPGAGR